MSDDLLFFNVVNNNHMQLKKFDTLSSLLQSICSLLIFLFVSWSKVMILLVIPKYVGLSGANYAKNLLRATVLLQYVPRIIRFVPLLDGQSANGFIFESAWANFVINLLMFVLAGHVVGSCWYLFGLQVSQFFLLRLCTMFSSIFWFKCSNLDNHTNNSIHYWGICILQILSWNNSQGSSSFF